MVSQNLTNIKYQKETAAKFTFSLLLQSSALVSLFQTWLLTILLIIRLSRRHCVTEHTGYGHSRHLESEE